MRSVPNIGTYVKTNYQFCSIYWNKLVKKCNFCIISILMMTKKQKEKIVNLLRLYECFGIKYIEPITLINNDLNTNKTLPNTFKKLYEYIDHCNLCELSKICEKNMEISNSHSSIYLVGLNSNFNDITIRNDLAYFFEEIMEKSFNEVYMTNIIKCETNNLNFDYSTVVSQCKEYFSQELALGKPKYIFATLQACKYILKIENIDNSFVGKSYRLGESILFPIFDLSFIAKNPSYKEEMVRVFNKIKGLIR